MSLAGLIVATLVITVVVTVSICRIARWLTDLYVNWRY